MSRLMEIFYGWACKRKYIVAISTSEYHQFTPVDDLPFDVVCLPFPTKHKAYYFFYNLEDAQRLIHMLRFRKLDTHELITIDQDKLEEIFKTTEARNG